MSNFTCPTCGLTNIDGGEAGYKTNREIIDLKQEIVRVTDYNKQLTYLIKQRDIYNKELEKKLKTAVKALRIYANLRYDGTVTGYETIAKEALKEIKG